MMGPRHDDRWRILALLALGVGAGCLSSEAPGPAPVEYEDRARCEIWLDAACVGLLEPGPVDPAGVSRQYVVDSIEFGITQEDALAIGLDLDCSEPTRGDNKLGQVLALTYEFLATDLNQITRETIEAGRIIHLIEVRAPDLEDALGVSAQVFVGRDTDGDPSDNFSGSERFAVDGSEPSAPMVGFIEGGRLFADAGQMPMQIAIPGIDEPSTLELSATMMDGDILADRLVVTVGGVLTPEALDEEFLPLVHSTMVSVVESECSQGTCPPGSRGEQLLWLFDGDGDGAISYEELVNNALLTTLLAPDMDMLDQDGNLAPGCDRERESLSFAVQLTAVPATF